MVGDQVTRDVAQRRLQMAEDVGRARCDPRIHVRNRNSHLDQLAPKRITAMVDGGECEGYPRILYGLIDRSLFGDRCAFAEGDGLYAFGRKLPRVERKPSRVRTSFLAVC